MIRAVLRRLLAAAGTLVVVAGVVFALVATAPGDPLDPDDSSARGLGAERREALRAHLRLDRPLPERFVSWIGDAARGDLGRSLIDRRPVVERIGERLPTSLTLNALALLLMLGVAIPLGAECARRPGSRLDRIAGAGATALYATPIFWTAILLQLVVGARLGWLPLYGVAGDGAAALPPLARAFDRLAHLVLPAVCLAHGGIAFVSRFVRTSLLETRSASAGRAVLARGGSDSTVLWNHGFRRSAIALLTLAGLLLPRLVGGSILVEWIFALPGLGRLFVESVLARDLPVVLGLTLLSGAFTLFGVVGADLAYAVADPRVRHGR